VASDNQLTKYECDLLFIVGICPDCEAPGVPGNLRACAFTDVVCVNCGSKFYVYPPTYAERRGGAHETA